MKEQIFKITTLLTATAILASCQNGFKTPANQGENTSTEAASVNSNQLFPMPEEFSEGAFRNLQASAQSNPYPTGAGDSAGKCDQAKQALAQVYHWLVVGNFRVSFESYLSTLDKVRSRISSKSINPRVLLSKLSEVVPKITQIPGDSRLAAVDTWTVRKFNLLVSELRKTEVSERLSQEEKSYLNGLISRFGSNQTVLVGFPEGKKCLDDERYGYLRCDVSRVIVPPETRGGGPEYADQIGCDDFSASVRLVYESVKVLDPAVASILANYLPSAASDYNLIAAKEIVIECLNNIQKIGSDYYLITEDMGNDARFFDKSFSCTVDSINPRINLLSGNIERLHPSDKFQLAVAMKQIPQNGGVFECWAAADINECHDRRKRGTLGFKTIQGIPPYFLEQ